MTDKPKDRPKVADAFPLIRAIYQRQPMGCCLHILTDDGNVEQGHADGCLETARAHGHADCIVVAEMLVAMTTTQRHKVYKSSRQWRPE